MDIPDQTRQAFLETVWDYYARQARDELPWRQPTPDGSFDPYHILVSELMLQQTQVSRVIPKYLAFLADFPTVESLAAAELGDVLRLWQGLGYNRRAKFLWQAAQAIGTSQAFPRTVPDLIALPGVGRNTAGAIMAYAYNEPVLYVETNIRSVYLHHFFPDQDGVSDADILACLDATLDREQPRHFYWALMDYGSYLKSTVGKLTRASKHYVKQSAFHGSRRQVRGAVLRQLAAGPAPHGVLSDSVRDERLEQVLRDLLREGLIQQDGDTYHL